MMPPDSRLLVLLLAAFVTAEAGAQVRPINDTGQRQYFTATALAPQPDPLNFPGQDPHFGRDAAAGDDALPKLGRGASGFDFTRLGADGQPLAIQGQPWARDAGGFDAGSEAAGTRWSCVRDHTTGLDWEVRTRTLTPGLRDRDWTYSWFSSAARPDGTANANNGGDPGGENLGTCFNKFDEVSNPTGNRCDTAGYVAAVNAASLCGTSTWRMPTRLELQSLVHYGTRWPAIDTDFFPNVPGEFGNPNIPTPNVTWSGTPGAFSDEAWPIYFDAGASLANQKIRPNPVILVRSAP
jgi:hypothetical protein